MVFQGFKVNLATILTIPEIQMSLLWEAHEVNFYTELMALDILLMHRKDWMEINQWEHKMLVSGIWGWLSLAATVAAPTNCASCMFC